MTEEQFKKIAPNLNIEYSKVMELLNKYEINTPDRIAGFFAQCGHESGDFKVKVENLNYSADRLKAVFPKYFKTRDPNAYARKPELIASLVYGNRMGNGDESSKEGYKFRGRGFIQLTGKTNYTAFADSIGKSIDEAISYLETDEGSLESALFYWKKANCNKHCDSKNQTALCKSINGGTHGLDDRTKRFNKIKSIFG